MLTAAYAGGLISHDTFTGRVDQLLKHRVIDPASLVGDLTFRRDRGSTRVWIGGLARLLATITPRRRLPLELLALDWSGGQTDLLVGRHDSCDVVLSDPSVSRRHARLVFRDARWIVVDLGSTNGTEVNGARVGRCEIRPGDRLVLGCARLKVD